MVQISPVRQSQTLRTGALAGAGEVGAVVGTPRAALTALVDIFTGTAGSQAVAGLTPALNTQHTQILTSKLTTDKVLTNI